jgi:hypothetical protein
MQYVAKRWPVYFQLRSTSAIWRSTWTTSTTKICGDEGGIPRCASHTHSFRACAAMEVWRVSKSAARRMTFQAALLCTLSTHIPSAMAFCRNCSKPCFFAVARRRRTTLALLWNHYHHCPSFLRSARLPCKPIEWPPTRCFEACRQDQKRLVVPATEEASASIVNILLKVLLPDCCFTLLEVKTSVQFPELMSSF